MVTLNYYFPLEVSEEAIAVVARLVSNHVMGDTVTTEKLLGGWAIYVSGERVPRAGCLEEVRLSTGVYTLMTGLVDVIRHVGRELMEKAKNEIREEVRDEVKRELRERLF